MSDLFASSDLDRASSSEGQNSHRPLADQLRPQALEDVVGQDHLCGEEGSLTRMVRSGSLGSLVFWGPPGCGKTTVARLLANETDLVFQQISAIFSVLPISKRYSRRHGNISAPAKPHCFSSTRFIASTARN